jgi:Holliday junction resolvase RusA-like endonuclease
MAVIWTEAQLKERLDKNPALRINERYSQPVKKRKVVAPKVSKIATLPPMRFYLQELPVKLFLPFVYPSLNKWTRMNRWERKRVEDEFRDEVRWEIIRNQIMGFKCKVSIQVIIYHPVDRYRDRDNYCYKWLKDALKGIVIIDDDPRYVEDLPVQFAKGKKHMDVWIRPI